MAASYGAFFVYISALAFHHRSLGWRRGGCTWCILITARSLFFSRLPKGSRAAGVAGRYSVVGDNSDLSFNDPVGTDPVVSNDSVKFPKYLK